MKKLCILTFACLALSSITTAYSAMMEVTWTGTITQMRPEPEFRYGLNNGDEIWISAIYDDSGTEMHIFSSNDGSIVRTLDTSTNPDLSFLSDAVFSFSANLNEFINNSWGESSEVYAFVYQGRDTGNFFTQLRSNATYFDVNLRSAGDGVGYIDLNSSPPVAGGLQDGRRNPIYFSSLTYSISSYNPSPPPSPASVPEPTTTLLFSTGLVSLVAKRFRKKN